MSDELPWLYPHAFCQDWKVDNSVIDHYGHVNNVAYVSQIEKLAWAHSNALGLTIEQYRELDRGMAIQRHELDYLQACHEGQTIACATWIVACDKRLSLSRQFQFICRERQKPVFQARTHFVCIALSSGRPKKMPTEFSSVYGPAMLDPSLTEAK